MYYLALSLRDASGDLLSENFYILGAEPGNLKALRTLPAAKLSILPGDKSQERAETKTPQNVTCLKTWTLRNDSDTPALLVRLILKDRSGEEILPVDYSDNYFALMPGEEKTVTVRWRGTSNAHIAVTQLGDYELSVK